MESNPHDWLSSCDKTSPVCSGVEEALLLFDMRSLTTDLHMKAFSLHILGYVYIYLPIQGKKKKKSAKKKRHK